MSHNYALLYFMILSFSWISEASNIVLLYPSLSKSHSLWYEKVALVLLNNGHQVHLLNGFEMKYQHENLTQVYMKIHNYVDEFEKISAASPDFLLDLVKVTNPLSYISLTLDPNSFHCEDFLQTAAASNFIRNYKNIGQVDLIISDLFCVCFMGIVPLFGKPPLIIASPYSDSLAHAMAIMDNPSYVPLRFSYLKPKMKFLERVYNTLLHISHHIIWRHDRYYQHDKILKKYFADGAPLIENIIHENLRLIMVGDYDYAINGAKPLSPMVVSVAGLHIDPPKPLPKEVQEFLDGADNGAIIFSMGSTFKSILISLNIRNMFLNVFKKLPQRIIWKLEVDDISGIPPNVMITKWMLQSDVLAHRNVKCFISHGGTHSTQEAVFRGVPIVGMGLFVDQLHNIEQLKHLGVAVSLDYSTLNEDKIFAALNNVLNNPSYRERISELSRVVKDNPQTPQERLLFWSEYVIRHANNSKNYLRPLSMDLPWYEVLLLDVLGFIFLAIVLVFKTISKLPSLLFNKRAAYISVITFILYYSLKKYLSAAIVCVYIFICIVVILIPNSNGKTNRYKAVKRR